MEKIVKHDHRDSELHYCLDVVDQEFVVDDDPAEVLEPEEGALENPSFQHLKFGRAFSPEHGLLRGEVLAERTPLASGFDYVRPLSHGEDVSSSFLVRL